jgi:hypothetical protein
MTKLQYLIRPPSGQPPGVFSDYLLDGLGPTLLALGPERLKLTISDPAPPRLAVIPFARRSLGLISIWSDPARPPDAWNVAVLEAAGGYSVSGYRVEESLPVTYRRDWPDGQRTPGVGLLTLLNRRRGLDDATFMQRWHGKHSPLSLAIHPLWCYVRNVVRERLIPDSPRWDGVVEEHFQRREDLLDPRRFFGGALMMLPNMARVAADVAGFLDVRSLETYLAHEVHLR